jgi:hypothetical protein
MASTFPWEKLAHHSHLYVFPVLGGVALVLGVLGTFGMAANWIRVLPLALLTVGSFVLVGSVGSYMCLRPPRVRSLPAPAKEPTPETSPSPFRSEQPHHSPRKDSRAEEKIPHSGIGRATLAHLTHLEDELWRQWESPHGVTLGTPLVGPVASSAYSAHRSGGVGPFADRDSDVVVLSTDTTSAVPSRPERRTPASQGPPPRERAPDRRFERDEHSTAVVPRYALPRASPDLAEAGSFLSMRGAMPAGMDALDNVVELDSINPILPRLRPTAPVGPSQPVKSSRVATVRSEARRLCTECSGHLAGFRSWAECRLCRKPLCRECLQESFERDEPGACAECQQERARSYRVGASTTQRPERGSTLRLVSA